MWSYDIDAFMVGFHPQHCMSHYVPYYNFVEMMSKKCSCMWLRALLCLTRHMGKIRAICLYFVVEVYVCVCWGGGEGGPIMSWRGSSSSLCS